MAILYGYAQGTKALNQAVRRNINRFPARFYFQLNQKEYQNILRSQNVTLELKQGKYSKYLPYVFTEQGVAMLATILKTSVATKISINIMDAFVKMRKYIVNNNYNERISNLETKSIEQDSKIDILFDKLETKEQTNHIFFEGQIYDAYSLLIDILNKAKKEIIIIDNYASKELFDILKEIKVSIKIITKNIDDTLLQKYQKQYNNIEIINKDNFHDRFIIIDKETLYHSGASFKDLGKKCFGINKIEDKNYLKQLLESVN